VGAHLLGYSLAVLVVVGMVLLFKVLPGLQ